MISIDDGLKILLIITISLSILLLTIAVVRLLNQVTGAVEDSRSAIKNVTSVSSMIEQDILSVRSKFSNIGKSLNIVNAVTGIVGSAGIGKLLSRFRKK
jgi:hypothetical protein